MSFPHFQLENLLKSCLIIENDANNTVCKFNSVDNSVDSVEKITERLIIQKGMA